jgi:ribonucleoside-diphosphate reductase beta chain
VARSAEAAKGTAQRAMRRMAQDDPELAARLLLQSLPLAAAPLPEGLSYRLELRDLGVWSVRPNGGLAEVVEVPGGAALDGDSFAIETDAATLARLAGGASPLGALARRRLRLRGSRRKALALRRLNAAASPRELAQRGLPVDADLLLRSLAYAIEPEWTRGHRFAILYQLVGEGGGTWLVRVDDGKLTVTPGGSRDQAESVVRIEVANWLKLLSGELTPSESSRLGLTELEGPIYPVTLFGRWIDRAEGVDGPELEREERQRRRQAARAGTWGARGQRSSDPGDPAESRRRRGLMSYQELYALWERQNWRAQELDFSADREHWLVTPSEAQRHTAFSMGSFYVGEERVTADLAPFLLAAPSGEIEAFLATQLVDEMRHAVFFDRWMAEVMALEADDLRGRLQQIESELLTLRPWHFLFDDSLREIANRIKARPDDLELFVEGIVTYHMVTEGLLAMPAQRVMIQYTSEHEVYPGFNRGFRLVERDEHRHIAFGVRFLKDVCEERPQMRKVILRRLDELLPRAAETLVPPEADDPTEFVSYGYHSSQIYGFAYQALRRRMAMIGIELPGPEQLMPGPVDFSGLHESRPLAERV